MTENLAFENDRLRDAALTTTLRVRRMVLAVIIDCVPLILWVCAILAFLVASMSLWTFFALGCNKTIKRLVLTIGDHAFVLIHAVGALLIGAVMASNFCRHDVTSLTDAVGTLGWGGMIAATLLFFLFDLLIILVFLACDCAAHAMHALLRWNMMASWCLARGTRFGFIIRGCGLIRSLSRSINHVADSIDNWAGWCLAVCQARHICVLVPHMQDVAISEFQRLDSSRVAAGQRFLERFVSE